MIWRPFRKSSTPAIDAAWWQAADDAASASPTQAIVEQLAAMAASSSAAPDEAERQDEMIAGLRDLVALSGAALPVIPTQHRVIGTDLCHLIAPVSLGADAGAAGKLFLTSTRLVFVSGRVTAWPWHRVRALTRAGRDLVVIVGGEPEPVVLRCNTYGEAIVAHHMAKSLSAGGTGQPRGAR